MNSIRDIHWVQVARIWYRNFVIFKRTWMISLFWILLEPVFMLGALGFGLGSFIKTMEGVSYVEFYFPGLLCTSSMMVAFFESTYANFTKLTYSKVYASQLLSPITGTELIVGDIFWGATKGFLSGIGILFVGSFFGLGWSLGTIPFLLVLFLNAWIFSCLGMIFTSIVRNYDQIIYPTSGLIVPMSLFSGTYFPITDLNPILKGVFYLLPLTHIVEVSRSLILRGIGAFENPFILLQLGIIIVVAFILTRIAITRMIRRLSI